MITASRLGLALVAVSLVLAAHPAAGLAACANPVACENEKPGTAPSAWQVSGNGDPSIQGYATSMSVNLGGTIRFKIKTTATGYHIDIYRLGYYQGNGARLQAAGRSSPTASLPQSQPACLTDAATGLIDCGNWGVSASWTVPAASVSGVYIARLVRDDTGGASQIPFVVRDDAGVLGHARADVRRHVAGLQRRTAATASTRARSRARRGARPRTRARSRSPTTARSTGRSRRTTGARTSSTPSTR